MEAILVKIKNYNNDDDIKKGYIDKYIESIYDLIEAYQFKICGNFDKIKKNTTISNMSNKKKEYFTIYNEYVNSIIKTLDSVLEQLKNTPKLENEKKLQKLIYNFSKIYDRFSIKKTNLDSETSEKFDCFFDPKIIVGGNKKTKKNKKKNKFTKTKQHKLKNNYSKKH